MVFPKRRKESCFSFIKSNNDRFVCDEFLTEHDDRDAPGGSGYHDRGGGHFRGRGQNNKNFVWRRGDPVRKKQVSFKDRGGGGGGRGGNSIKKRLGPRVGSGSGGGANLKHVYVDLDGDAAMSGDPNQAGRSRPIRFVILFHFLKINNYLCCYEYFR